MAEEIELIETHEDDALDRLLEQYKGKPQIEGVISSITAQIQDMENVAYSLIVGRAIATAEGVQLDLIGTIVGLARVSGQSDDTYRTLLYVKIGTNTSQGAPPKIISIYKLLTGASVVFYQNLTRASILLAVDIDIDPDNDPDAVRLIYQNIQNVVAGGVKVDYLICFSPDEDAFAFAGSNSSAPAKGFGSTLDSEAGGKLAHVHRLIIPFAFDGLSVNRGGFGSIRDPLVGGTLVTT